MVSKPPGFSEFRARLGATRWCGQCSMRQYMREGGNRDDPILGQDPARLARCVD